MFETIVAAPPDPILGLTEAFKHDPNTKKVNLGVGVYKDAGGQTPVLASVKTAEERLLRSEHTKNYLPIDGQPEFDSATQELLLGADHPLMQTGRVVTAQAPGGTGALRVAADFVASTLGKRTVWLSDPTLTFQLRQGFVVRELLQDYLEDSASDNWATLILWENPDYRAPVA